MREHTTERVTIPCKSTRADVMAAATRIFAGRIEGGYRISYDPVAGEHDGFDFACEGSRLCNSYSLFAVLWPTLEAARHAAVGAIIVEYTRLMTLAECAAATAR